jgi:hypothetical protein
LSTWQEREEVVYAIWFLLVPNYEMTASALLRASVMD